MPLYGSKRDIKFFRGINKELLWDIITQQVVFYKLELGSTPFNIYGEASQEKFYSQPLVLNCLIERGGQEYVETDWGTDLQWNHDFWILNDDLKEANVTPQIGDILMYEENFYEISSLIQNQLFVGKDPSKTFDPNPYKTNLKDFGYNVSTVCKTHYVPKDKVGINLEERII